MLDAIQAKIGIVSRTEVLRLAIRVLAEQEKVKPTRLPAGRLESRPRSVDRPVRCLAQPRIPWCDYTKYGTTVGVTYPLDPDYPYCGDASNPINLTCITSHPLGPTAIAHELGHVFTEAYPYVYYFDYQGAGCGNNEAVPLFLVGYLTDPKGGGAFAGEAYWRYEENMLTSSSLRAPAFWHDALVSDAFPFFYKNMGGGSGSHHETDAYTRAKNFYLRLVASIADMSRRNAFMGQLARWGVPFVPAGTTFVDADGDGIVAGLDYNDADARINPYSEECSGTVCVADGIDQNQNGYVDEGILKKTGETLALGADDIAYTDIGTRRKLYLAAGSKVRIAVTSNKPVGVLTYADNVLFTDPGPLWWYESGSPVAEVGESTNPVLTFTAPTSSVYTFQFFGYSDHGVNLGDTISYTATITP